MYECAFLKEHDPATTSMLSEEAMRLLATLAQRRGISRTAVLEMLIREAARRDEREEGQEQRTR